MKLTSIFAFAGALLLCASAAAHDYRAGDLHIEHPYARTTVSGQPGGAAYLTIENKGKVADQLIGATSPIAKSVQMHTMTMEGDVMKMREAEHIVLQPSAKIVMKPGDGYHLMLIGLKRELKAGDKFPMTLKFEKAGNLEISVQIEEAGVRHEHH